MEVLLAKQLILQSLTPSSRPHILMEPTWTCRKMVPKVHNMTVVGCISVGMIGIILFDLSWLVYAAAGWHVLYDNDHWCSLQCCLCAALHDMVGQGSCVWITSFTREHSGVLVIPSTRLFLQGIMFCTSVVSEPLAGYLAVRYDTIIPMYPKSDFMFSVKKWLLTSAIDVSIGILRCT